MGHSEFTEKDREFIDSVPDEIWSKVAMLTMPWQMESGSTSERSGKDADGFSVTTGKSLKELQNECWQKFSRSPQVGTAIRGLAGRMTGWGFEVNSEVFEINEVIREITFDYRNRLYDFNHKYACRALIEGELFLRFTCHVDGFIEIDFVEPAYIGGIGADDTGIIFHPRKGRFPLFYQIIDPNTKETELIPSIFVARDKDLIEIAKENRHFYMKNTKNVRSKKRIFNQFGGFYQFIVSWDRSFITARALSYIVATLEWLNHYENLKKYEIDHKKSTGAFVWNYEFEDIAAWKRWLKLTDAERRNTGIMKKKTPGSTLISPLGMKLSAVNPQLPKLSGDDTDILDQVGSGLNEPTDVMQGRSGSNYASVKASRGPMSDRVSDEIVLWDRFLKYDFWGSIFFLRNRMIPDLFPSTFSVRQAVAFGKNGKPKFKEVERSPEHLIDITYPVSDTIDFEGRVKGVLGVKHGPISENLGISYSTVARKLGFNSYGIERLKQATEKERYPKLLYAVDQEAKQEKQEGEKPVNKSENPNK